ncbi:hypothetical protein niasHT_035420 [Heterodera trifolii]|uniref:Uncharacterized protein n=1 Tax=Heterodera trifolii TaxID=157864 RepID=A0ABD2HXT3_9BILA
MVENIRRFFLWHKTLKHHSLTSLNLHYANANFGPGFCSASFLLQFRPFGQSAACHFRLPILTRINKCRASGRTKKRKDSASTHRNNSSGGGGGTND